ncbi:MAG: class I SAM-dependent methyltransferase [Verrucomicrobia bacterium]|nr:class I SAM-dependent methyltransferase [Verrucomicrobiota bacterium]
MKLRESGMPAQDYWETLFDVPRILDAFGFDAATGDVAELGCGYGTFTVPLAQRIRSRVFALDLDSEMVAATRQRATAAGVRNVEADVRDVLAEGFGVPLGSCDAVLLFNILHGEEPVTLLRRASETVRPGGLVAVIHWRSDIVTPRGPSLAIRPRPAEIAAWAASAGLAADGESFLLPPWHYGHKLRRPG